MSIWRYVDYWTEPPPVERISLGEGETPLLRSRAIGPSLGLNHLYFKLETADPSASYKDRFAVTAVSDMLSRGAKACLATSSGNTGAALSAYCAAAGIDCFIAVVDGAPRNKLRQMFAYGARIFSVRQFGHDVGVTAAVVERLQKLAVERRTALQISAYCYSHPGMIGVETLAYELADQLQGQLDHVFCSAGGGGLCLAMARGFEKLRQLKKLNKLVAVECVQPEGNDTMAGPLARGEAMAKTTTSTTRISGLQVPTINDGHDVVRACRASGGTGHLVPDDLVFTAQARLAKEEGIFSEPAGATALAGALQARAKGLLCDDSVVVCCVTGSGFKDMASIDALTTADDCPLLETAADIDQLIP